MHIGRKLDPSAFFLQLRYPPSRENIFLLTPNEENFKLNGTTAIIYFVIQLFNYRFI